MSSRGENTWIRICKSRQAYADKLAIYKNIICSRINNVTENINLTHFINFVKTLYYYLIAWKKSYNIKPTQLLKWCRPHCFSPLGNHFMLKFLVQIVLWKMTGECSFVIFVWIWDPFMSFWIWINGFHSAQQPFLFTFAFCHDMKYFLGWDKLHNIFKDSDKVGGWVWSGWQKSSRIENALFLGGFVIWFM